MAKKIICRECGKNFMYDESEEDFFVKDDYKKPSPACPTCGKKEPAKDHLQKTDSRDEAPSKS